MKAEHNSAWTAVTPTFDPALTTRIPDRLGPITEHGRYYVVCNSAAAATTELPRDLVRLRPRQNLGFGAAANLAAAQPRGESLGLLILNDDVEVAPDTATEMARVVRGSGRSSVALFGRPEPRPGTPGRAGTLARVAGVWAFRKWLPSNLRGGGYPFYAAFVGWDVWDRIGGFDAARYPLYFEDSDLLARAAAVARPEQFEVELHHERSSTSRSRPETIGLLAFGAAHYLVDHCRTPRPAARGLVRFAMLIRVGFELVARQPRRSRAALRIAFRGLPTLPDLPGYDEFDLGHA